jgi:peptidyl-prolyl cis-trans isomerase A (cyclophilin A)
VDGPAAATGASARADRTLSNIRIPMDARMEGMEPSATTEPAPEVFQARFETSRGDFIVEVTRKWAPLGADRFYNLVKNGVFDGARFFRVLPGFVVQFGIPGDPAVARLWRSAQIADDPVVESNRRGRITFATSGPNSRTTQVFINLADNASLDGMGFAPFGRVAEGLEIVGQLHSGYGEGAPRGRGPEQGRIQAEGNAYLERQFPKLDHIKRAAILAEPV